MRCFWIFVLFLISFSNLCSAAVPYETPTYAIGSDFMIVDGLINGQLTSKNIVANILFDNTHIYLDNNNDGVWDYSFYGNSGGYSYLDPIIEAQRFGAKIHSDKPIAFYQTLILQQGQSHSSAILPISSWKKEYVLVAQPYGTWSLVADKNITVFYENANFSGNISLKKGEKKEVQSLAYSKFSSDDSFFAYNYGSPGASLGTDFFAPYTSIRLALPEDTFLQFDYNNDGFFDNETSYSKGTHNLQVVGGTHIKGSKKFALFSNLANYYFAAVPSSALGSDIFSMTGNARGVFSEATGFNGTNGTSIKVYRQAGNSFSNNLFVYSGENPGYPRDTYVHAYGNMPFLSFYLDSNSKLINSNSYSQIYFTTYSQNKYVSNNEPNTFVVRVFNPFYAENATNLIVSVTYPANFTSLANVVVERHNLINDALMSSSSLSYNPTENGFLATYESNQELAYLGPLQYLEIKYTLTTPDYLGKFEFPSARLSYEASSWIIS